MSEIKNIDFSNIDVNTFRHNLDANRVMELIGDTDIDELKKFKNEIIKNEILDLNDNNSLSDIKLIYSNIPDDISPIEKVRLVYMKLGKIFSYDYRVSDDMRYGKDKKIDPNEYIDRYQTCIQITEILNLILNQIDGVRSETVERKLDGINRFYGDNHVANLVTVEIGDGYYEKYLLDLTLDLYLIQSGCRTEHFGYETNINGDYDIIPYIDTDIIDKKLGLVSERGYTNNEIELVKEYLNNKDYSNMSSQDRIEEKLVIISSLFKTFSGYHEGKRYINMLFNELLHEKYREFNISSKTDNNTNLKTCYMIESDDYIKWIIYSNNMGFMSTTERNLISMLDNDWNTRSSTLKELLFKKNKTL